LPVSEEQREDPTMTINQIAIKDLRNTVDKLNLKTISIAKTDFVNNVPWSNIKSLLQLTFIDSATKLIICNGLIKYPPKDLRPIIIDEMHCLPTGGHQGVTKTYHRIKNNYYWENLKIQCSTIYTAMLTMSVEKTNTSKNQATYGNY